MTESELLLQKILTEKGVKHQKLPESATRTPDFQVSCGDMVSLWEVKELEENPDEREILKQYETGEGEVYSIDSDRIENQIKSACGQFKKYGVDDKPCVIVLCDMRDFAVKDLLLVQNIQALMLGSTEFAQNRDGQWVEVNRHSGMFTSRKEYVSAVVVIFSATEKALVLHNPNASNSLLGSELMSVFPDQYQAVVRSEGLCWEMV